MIKRSPLAVLCVTLSGSFTAACMPLEQAPLVYSSKQQIGVGVAVGTPDSPGFDINIGYKGLDAAFVPVIVAKKCDAKSGVKCDDIKYDLTPVLGNHEISTETKFDQARLRDTEDELTKERNLFGANQGILNKKAAELRVVTARAAATTKRDELAALRNLVGATPLTEVQGKELDDANNRVATADALLAVKSQADREEEVRKLREANSKTADTIKELENTRRRIQNELSASNGDTKKDALSVYGSFNGTAGGTKDGADLDVGKVFSTGIAAQNMSQGVANAARVRATAVCLDAALKIIADSKDESIRKSAFANCQ